MAGSVNSPLNMDKIQTDAFWSKVDIQDDIRSCWEWVGARKAKGYGNVRINKVAYLSHRIAFELAISPIPEGLIVMHLCDNPPCCNPSHLVLGSIRSNAFDMIKKNRQGFHKNRAVGVRNFKAKLNPTAVRDIRERYRNSGVRQKDLAAEYGVTQPTIGSIVRNETWREVK